MKEVRADDGEFSAEVHDVIDSVGYISAFDVLIYTPRDASFAVSDMTALPSWTASPAPGLGTRRVALVGSPCESPECGFLLSLY